MIETEKLDSTDLAILRVLQTDARIAMKELAARVSLSLSPVHERLKRLEKNGYIKKYAAILDAEKMGLGFMVFCQVKLRRINREIAASFVEAIQNIPEVTECYNISGQYDYLLKVRVRDMSTYRSFVINVLGTIESTASIESTFVMDEVKHSYGLNF